MATLTDDVTRSLDQLAASTAYVADYLAVTAELLRIREAAGEISAADRQRGLQAAVAAVRSPAGGASLAKSRRERHAAAERLMAATEARIGNARWPTDRSAAIYRERARTSMRDARILLAYLSGLDVSLVDAVTPAAEVFGWTQGRVGGGRIFDPLDAEIEAATKGAFANLPKSGGAGPAVAGASPRTGASPAAGTGAAGGAGPAAAGALRRAGAAPAAGTGEDVGTDGQTLQGTITRTYAGAGITSAQCRAACDSDGSCGGWVLVKPAYANPGCYLMTAVTNRIASPCCRSDVKAGQAGGTIAAATPTPAPAAAPAPGAGTPYDGVSLTGQTLRYYPRSTYPECDGDCQRDPNCRGWTWVKPGAYNAGDAAMCYLVARIDAQARHNCCISAVKNPAGIGTAGGAQPSTPSPAAQSPAGGSPQAGAVWTRWINRDIPDGSADWEALADMRGDVPCAKPVAIECRVASDKRDWRQAGQRYRCSLEEPNPGGTCVNADNPPNGCLDYEVRYLCPAR